MSGRRNAARNPSLAALAAGPLSGSAHGWMACAHGEHADGAPQRSMRRRRSANPPPANHHVSTGTATDVDPSTPSVSPRGAAAPYCRPGQLFPAARCLTGLRAANDLGAGWAVTSTSGRPAAAGAQAPPDGAHGAVGATCKALGGAAILRSGLDPRKYRMVEWPQVAAGLLPRAAPSGRLEGEGKAHDLPDRPTFEPRRVKRRSR